ncbi:fatty acid-binding protein-like [Ptychodera flava]|uniref:fatty acid-binding protein-like n=1 Tax=Ptychodera flava TaxID=63121 RepID=UPI00396A180B
MSQLVGKWKHDHSDNLDNFFKAMKVGIVARKLAGSTSPSVEITVSDDDTWTIVTNSGLGKTMTICFKIGDPFEDTRPDGAKVKAMAILEDDVLTIKPVDNPEGPSVSRQVVDGQMTMTLTKGGVTAKRTFKRV